jgi:hypothetical protein
MGESMRQSGVLIVMLGAFWPLAADAAAPDPYGPLAMITAGLSDGGQIAIGDSGAGKVSRSGAKAFQANLPTGQAGFLYDQPQPCVFTQTSQMKGQPPLTVQFNLNLVTGIEFADQGRQDNLNLIALRFDGTGEIVDFVEGDGSLQVAQPEASMLTSLTVDQLNQAAAALHAICPNK